MEIDKKDNYQKYSKHMRYLKFLNQKLNAKNIFDLKILI